MTAMATAEAARPILDSAEQHLLRQR